MSENTDFVALDDVQALVGDGGYEVSQETEGVLRIRDLDSGIVIRSAIVKNDVAYVRAGAGVVFDSIPQSEADETRRKAGAVLQAIKRAEGCLS